jgi:hypothetical protein
MSLVRAIVGLTTMVTFKLYLTITIYIESNPSALMTLTLIFATLYID